jgi:serine/threonine protein kinase
MYRDIKLENVLLDNDGHIIITDFGLAKDLTTLRNNRTKSYCGTIQYMAPEILNSKRIGYDHNGK